MTSALSTETSAVLPLCSSPLSKEELLLHGEATWSTLGSLILPWQNRCFFSQLRPGQAVGTMSPVLTKNSVTYTRTESVLILCGAHMFSTSQVLPSVQGTPAETVPGSFGSWFSGLTVL